MRILAVLPLLTSASSASAATATRETFAALPDGRKVEAVSLSNGHGMSVRIISFGAIIQSLSVPDRSGRSADVVLGYPKLDGYLSNPPYFGATVGRYANRIAGGRFALNGRTYNLSKEGPHSLHGGVKGFNKRLWVVTDVQEGSLARTTLSYVSADGEEGFPGTLHVTATFSLNERNELSIEYRATTNKATIVNLTSHSYFNLSGEASSNSILREILTIPAEGFTPTDKDLIPTGQIRSVVGTPFDFRKPTRIGRGIGSADKQLVQAHGYDQNFVVSSMPSTKLRLNARVEDADAGRVLEVYSNQPGIQFYSGNFLDGTIVGKSGKVYRQNDGLCLEPQLFPDTPNHPNFGTARLDPGQVYVNRILYRFSTSSRRVTVPGASGKSRRPSA